MRIDVDHGEVNRIAERMGCTRVTVSQALHYRKNSRLARQIRKVALEEFGGQVVK